MPAKVCPESFNWGRKAYLAYGCHHSLGWGPRLSRREKAWRCSAVIEFLSRVYKALGSIPNTTKGAQKQKTKK